ncbi:MAG TPA: urease accessory protein UreD [Terrimicrobiaceae bacterium]
MPNRGVQGHLHIECRADPSGKTFLSQQSFSAPVHLSKPYWDGNHLVINVVNPTAGLFAGDHIEMTVRVCAGARAVLTSPSAARVFRARESQSSAQVVQNFVVEGGGRLDVFPELLIPHGGARYAQTTRIEVHAGGQLFFTEMIAPGRTASGETFNYDKLEFITDLITAGRLAVSERYFLDSRSEGLQSLRRRFPNAYYASAFIVSPQPADEGFQRAVGALSKTRVTAAASRPSENVYAIKLIAADSMSLRTAIGRMRALGYTYLGGPEPSLRKL